MHFTKALGGAAFLSEPKPQITGHDPHRHHGLPLQAPAAEAEGSRAGGAGGRADGAVPLIAETRR